MTEAEQEALPEAEIWENINCFSYAMGRSEEIKDGKRDRTNWVYLGFGHFNAPVNEVARFRLTPAQARAIAQRLMQVADDVDASLQNAKGKTE